MKINNPKAQQRFTEMKTAMLLHAPFFASLMLDMLTLKVGKFDGVPTAGTDGKDVLFDEDFLASLSLPEAVFLCCHEVGHAMFMHMPRFKRYKDTGFDGKPFSMELANCAADYVINAMLVDAKIGKMPVQGLIDKKYTGLMTFEEVYRDLLKDAQFVNSSAAGQGDGNGHKPLDTHIPEVAKATDAEMKRAMASAAQTAKAMGKLPASLERWVDETLRPQVDWKELLRKFVTRSATRDATTWASPHRRRLVSQGVYLPAITGHAAGKIVFAVDTSGSMGAKEFDAGFAEAADIMATCRPEMVYLISCDAKVHDVHELPDGSDLYAEKPAMRGGGGTSFVPVFDEVREQGIEPAVLVYFTDGYGTFPSHPPPYPVIWVSTTKDAVQYPFGDVVNVDLSGYEG